MQHVFLLVVILTSCRGYPLIAGINFIINYSKEVNIDGSALTSGVYILVINKIYEFRLVKK